MPAPRVGPSKPTTQELAAKACDEMAQAIVPCHVLADGLPLEETLRPALMKRLTAALHSCAELLAQLAEDGE